MNNPLILEQKQALLGQKRPVFKAKKDFLKRNELLMMKI